MTVFLFIIFFSFSAILKDALTSKYSSVSSGHVAALAMCRMNGSIPFEKTIEQRAAMPLAPKNISCYTMTTNEVTSLRELLHAGLVLNTLSETEICDLRS